MKKNKIYFGLDLGTENIGYAATDENYKIIKVGKKRAIGIRSYDEAHTAAERRSYRTARRRVQRRKYRIALLQELFCGEMEAADENFFAKLNENTLCLEDRTFKDAKYSLFNDKNYTDKQFYTEYPTIYHLRKKLLEKPADDIRLLYLAVHHIIKYRGNFLTENRDIGSYKNPEEYFKQLNEGLQTLHEKASEDGTVIRDIKQLDISHADELIKIITNKNGKDKIAEACKLLHADDQSRKNLIGTIFGRTVNLITIFGKEKYSEEDLQNSKFTFADDFDLIEPRLSEDLEEHEYDIIIALKHLYDWQVLTKLLGDNEYLSQAMVDIYDRHKKDLKNLKYIIRKYAGDKYDHMFGEPVKNSKNPEIDNKINNYTKYIGGGFYNGTKLGRKYDANKKLQTDNNAISRSGRLGITCAADEFYADVKEIIKKLEISDKKDDEKRNSILHDIENGDFMPKIVSKNNATIPYQLNMAELKKILDISSEKYKFLDETQDGYRIKEKIEKLLEFRIPYYVGPLKYYADEKNNIHGWAKRKSGMEETKITPWNFDSVIDKPASKEAFISKMTVNCTYLKNEKTLPKKSMLFCAFVCLNELNKLKINDGPISVELKQKIFKEVYLKKAKPTSAKIKEYLKNNGYGRDLSLSLRDEDMHGDMKVYIDFKNIIGDKLEKYQEMAEDLIFLMTIFTDSPASIENGIRDVSKKYGGILSEEEIKKLKGLKYKGWGSLSEGLICGSRKKLGKGITLTDEYGSQKDILDILWETNYNFMEIINDPRYGFDKAMKEYNKYNDIKPDPKITYDDIEELYCSPSVKRCLWQSYKIVEDLVKNIGEPAKIFIESTRSNTDIKKKKRTLTRKEQLENLYKEAERIDKEHYAQLNGEKHYSKLKECGSGELNAEKYFLYFLQLCRDIYSDKPIDPDNLKDYDVDHIIPQSMLKDDSLNNKVLTEKTLNAKKSDSYPLDDQFRKEKLWRHLNKMKLMSDEKYQRLTRRVPVSAEEQKGFVNRQLVETSQTVKLSRDLLKRYFYGKDVEIVMSKAANVSDFRKDYNLTKSREANDFHHACDAYLNIVVGNVLNEKFNHGIERYDKHDDSSDKSYNFRKSFENRIYSAREKRCIWYPKREIGSTLKVIEKELSGYDFNMSKMLITGKGELYGATIFKAGVSGSGETYPINEGKLKDTKKYGYKKTSGTAYFLTVDSLDKKGRPKRTIEAVPIFYDKKISSGKMTVDQFLREILKLKKPSAAKIKGLKDGKLMKNSLLDFGGYKLRLTGSNKERLLYHNANELYVTKEQNDYIKELSIISEKVKKEFDLQRKDIVKDGKTPEENAIFVKTEEEKARRDKYENQKSVIIHITKEKNLKLYDFFTDKLKNKKSPYKNIPSYSSLANILILGRDCFEAMNEYLQLRTLLKLIAAFQCNALNVDSSDIVYTDNKGEEKRGGKNQCNITTSKDITDKDIVFISQSVTGLKEKRIPLN